MEDGDHSRSYLKDYGSSISIEMPFFRILAIIVSKLTWNYSLDMTTFSTCWLRSSLPIVRDRITIPLLSLLDFSLTARRIR